MSFFFYKCFVNLFWGKTNVEIHVNFIKKLYLNTNKIDRSLTLLKCLLLCSFKKLFLLWHMIDDKVV